MSLKTVVVGMSGGVDSSVAAYLLKKQGYRVIGLFMKNWEEEGNCTSSLDYADVVQVCDQIGISHYSVNFAKDYWDNVFQEFLRDCQNGLTPNPDILCNREIKFKSFWQKAQDLGADFIATGHYCQTDQKSLLKGNNLNKDQSYFLYAIEGKVLKNVLFPIGHLPKAKVRKIAQEIGLQIHDKKDSTGICFIGKRNFKSFLSKFLGFQKGPIINLEGKKLGEHDGLAYYTLGQRKGLQIGGPGEPWFVIEKDLKKNTLIVEQGIDHPQLFKTKLTASDLTWIQDPPISLPFHCYAKVRYRQQDQKCVIEKIKDGLVYVSFSTPQRAITPGQSVVFYENDVCLGGGKIIYDTIQKKITPPKL